MKARNLFRRSPRWAWSSCAIVLAGAAVLFALAGTSRPPVELTFIGFKTNLFVHADASNDVYVCAVIRMANTGSQPVKFEADMDRPRYNTLHLDTNGWVDSSFGFCGLAVSEKTLGPGQSLTFTFVVDPEVPSRIEVQYRTSDFKLRLRRHLPAWLLTRVPWFARESVATTGVIQWAEKPVARGLAGLGP